MARVPQVTRTIQTTRATVFSVDTETKEVNEREIVLPRTYKNFDAILKAAKTIIGESKNERFVHVVNAEVVETLYGMSEAKFIEYAEILPPRTATVKEEA